jgi:hypothetical protein
MTSVTWATVALAMTKEERLFLWTGVLLVVIVAGAMVIARVDAWRKRQMEAGDETPTHVGSFRAMFDRGELSREEYDEVLRRMAAKAGAKAKPVVTPAPAPNPDPPPAAEGPPASPTPSG